MFALAKALENKKNLISLSVGANPITESSVKRLASALQKNPIQRLSIHTTNIGDRVVKMLTAALMGSQHLIKIDLSHTYMCEKGAAAVSDLLRTCKNLYELVLKGYSIDNDGIKLIAAQLASHKRLTVLRLDSNNRIDDEGYADLAKGLIENKSLVTLACPQAGIKALTRVFTTNTSLLTLLFSHENANTASNIDILALIEALKKQNNFVHFRHQLSLKGLSKAVRDALHQWQLKDSGPSITLNIEIIPIIQLIRSYRVDRYSEATLAKAIQTLEDNVDLITDGDHEDYKPFIASLLAFRYSLSQDELAQHAQTILSSMRTLISDDPEQYILENLDNAHYVKKFINLIIGKVDALNEGDEEAQRQAVVSLVDALECELLREEAKAALIPLLNNGVINAYLTEETKEALDYLLLEFSIETPAETDLMMFALNAYARLNQLSEPSYRDKIELCKKPEERIKEFKAFVEKEAAAKQMNPGDLIRHYRKQITMPTPRTPSPLEKQGLFRRVSKTEVITEKEPSPRSEA